ncbi:MAG: glycosyltransferase family 2 protein [Pseudobdellovibrio sp.]
MQICDVTVVIVNWNGGFLLDQCLEKLGLQTLKPKHILLMDNGSTDDSAQRAKQVPGVTVHFSQKNLGFAQANNEAVSICETEFVALLNPDALAETTWLESLVKAARTFSGVAIFGSRQMMLGKTGYVDGIGDSYHFSGLVWRNGYGRLLNSNLMQAKPIFSACACAALYRLEALKKVGGFDNDYFCYVEDIDLGFRLKSAGYKALYVPEAVVFHAGSASTGGGPSAFSIYHGQRNLIWTYVKNMPNVLFWIFLPMHIVLNLFSLIYFVRRGAGRIALRAKYHAILGLPKMWRKRQYIQSQRCISTVDIWVDLDKSIIPRK